MTAEEFNAFCRSLPATTSVVQWGGSHVWKVGGKVFAIGNGPDGDVSVTFKAGDISYEVLKTQPGLRPAPYLASRGLKWIQHYSKPGSGWALIRCVEWGMWADAISSFWRRRAGRGQAAFQCQVGESSLSRL